MMPQSSRIQPPLVAAWLVEQFLQNEHAESILGDLEEEYAELATKLGVGGARRWYWRQSGRTIVRLIGAEFGVAPLSLVGIVLGGFLLLVFCGSLPEQLIIGVIHLRRHHITPYYGPAGLASYVLWLNVSFLIGHLLVSLLAGCVVAAAAKGREMVATMTLGLVSPVMTSMLFLLLGAKYVPPNPTFLSTITIPQITGSCLIVIGGFIVRESRVAMSRRRSGA
jgi:hypothetical protein